MRRKIGCVCIVAGVVCIFAALSLLLHNQIENSEARRRSEEFSTKIIGAIVDKEQEEDNTGDRSGGEISFDAYYGVSDPYNPEMSSLVIEGHRFIGFLSIPELGLELPVFASWDYDKLTMAPCCYSGSFKSDDLVIAAHNYLSHFGYLQTLKTGDEINFLDVDGFLHRYSVREIETLPPDDVENMVESDFDLTLFTCTYGGENRVTVRCERIK